MHIALAGIGERLGAVAVNGQPCFPVHRIYDKHCTIVVRPIAVAVIVEEIVGIIHYIHAVRPGDKGNRNIAPVFLADTIRKRVEFCKLAAVYNSGLIDNPRELTFGRYSAHGG